MNITIKTETINPLKKVTLIDDGKNTVSITTDKLLPSHITTIQSNGDSIYPIMDLLKILEAVG